MLHGPRRLLSQSPLYLHQVDLSQKPAPATVACTPLPTEDRRERGPDDRLVSGGAAGVSGPGPAAAGVLWARQLGWPDGGSAVILSPLPVLPGGDC